MAFDCDAFQQSAFQNDCGAAPPPAETPSGGWGRKRHTPFRDETENDREARIKAERVRMGILEEAGDLRPEAGAREAEAAEGRPRGSGSSLQPTAYSLQSHLLPEDLAGLDALAARAVALTIDEELRRYFRMQDDEDESVLLIALAATLH